MSNQKEIGVGAAINLINQIYPKSNNVKCKICGLAPYYHLDYLYCLNGDPNSNQKEQEDQNE